MTTRFKSQIEKEKLPLDTNWKKDLETHQVVDLLDVKRDYLCDNLRGHHQNKEGHDCADDQLGVLSPRARERAHESFHRTAGPRTEITKYHRELRTRSQRLPHGFSRCGFFRPA
jgi:hypothetical protein